MNLFFIIMCFLTILTSSIISYSIKDFTVSIEHDENWVRDVICTILITLSLCGVLILSILNYTVQKFEKMPFIILTLINLYCSWDILTRHVFIQERQSIQLIAAIFLFLSFF